AYAEELNFETQMASAADPDEAMPVQMASGQSGSGRSGSKAGTAAGAAAGAAGAAAGAARDASEAAGDTTGKVARATGEAARGEGPAMTPSALTGKTVVSAEGEEVGEVAGIVMNGDGDQLARVRLDGGFLGIGATEIVLPVSELSTTT